MPLNPIRSRELFYDALPDGTLVMLPWALVNTSLGGMIEPVPMSLIGRDKITNVNLQEIGFNRITQFDEDKFFSTFQTGGPQYPVDYSRV
jgi:hypothetical protein